VAMVACGFWFRHLGPRLIGIGLTAVTFIRVFLREIARDQLIVRVIALMISEPILLNHSLLYQKFRARIEPTAGTTVS